MNWNNQYLNGGNSNMISVLRKIKMSSKQIWAVVIFVIISTFGQLLAPSMVSTMISDGVNVKDYKLDELRDTIGYVPQKNVLFTGNIAENLNWGNENGTNREVSDEEMIEAAKSVCADNFIRTMPGGYDLMLSKGAENISQGQRQLLTIARAIIANPEIMILYEATSNVDAHTEQDIQNAMATLMKGRTGFVIAHRLSTIRDAAMILYMENGDIKEVGNHETLMAKGGKYADLYNSQFA